MKSESQLEALQAKYSKAVKAELESDWDQAFRLYVKTAESYLHLSRTTTDESLRGKCKTSAGKALERAEKIKSKRKDVKPVVVDPFSVEEQFYVLKKSSLVNNLQFPPWDEPVAQSGSGPLFEDPDGQPKLSPQQVKVSTMWLRSANLVPNATMVSTLLPDGILQRIVTDCSVCASFSVCLEHHRRFGSKLGLSSMYPQDACGTPQLSQGGRYDLRMFFNGTYRRIAIDDKLPFHPDGSPMCVSTRCKQQFWPSILEKAYMKLMGGYDFPGSNSSADIHVLTGWIPEHIQVKSSNFQRETTWHRISSGFLEGLCVLTVGTGENPKTSWKGIDLPASHCYAVIDMAREPLVKGRLDLRETNERRQITLLDPRVPLSTEEPNDNAAGNTMEMEWNNVCDIFDGIYINWDTSLLGYQTTFHGTWSLNNIGDQDWQAACRHLQLTPKKSADSSSSGVHDVWVLLTRHLSDTRRNAEYIALRLQSDDDIANTSDSNKIASKGSYTNSTFILETTQFSSACGSLSIFASYDGLFEDTRFTVTAFSHVAMEWLKNLPKTPFSTKVTGNLTSKNAGGNCSFPTFMLNPQYHLRIHPEQRQNRGPGPKAEVILIAQGLKDMPIHLTVVWSKGERMVELVQSDVAAHSGAYSCGLVRVAAKLPAGDYTVVLSAFESSHRGPFTMMVESSHRFELTAIPQEGAGMYTKTIRGAWDEATAMGSPASKRYAFNPIFEVDIPSLIDLKVRLQLTRPSSAIAINVSLFPQGVATPQVSVKPGKYWLVPSTYNPGPQAEFRVIVYSTAAGVCISPKKLTDQE